MIATTKGDFVEGLECTWCGGRATQLTKTTLFLSKDKPIHLVCQSCHLKHVQLALEYERGELGDLLKRFVE